MLLPRALRAVTFVAVLLTLGLAIGNVHDTDGAICGSAWRAATGRLSFTGDRTDAERSAAAADCERAGERRLVGALAVAVVGVAAYAGTRYADRRSHSA